LRKRCEHTRANKEEGMKESGAPLSSLTFSRHDVCLLLMR
jgi:hypothetical protein